MKARKGNGCVPRLNSTAMRCTDCLKKPMQPMSAVSRTSYTLENICTGSVKSGFLPHT
jgi:hypothetical protein